MFTLLSRLGFLCHHTSLPANRTESLTVILDEWCGPKTNKDITHYLRSLSIDAANPSLINQVFDMKFTIKE